MTNSASSSLRSACVLSVLLLASGPGSATTYVMVSDQSLADQSPVIVEVQVLGVDSSPGTGEPETHYQMAVERVIRGEVAASPLTIRVRGGELEDGVGLHVYGAPRFAEQERALLFLKAREDGTYGIMHFMLGAFHLVDLDGREVAVRHLEETVELTVAGRTPVRRGPRDLEQFRAWLRDRTRGVDRQADYFLESLDPDVASYIQKFTLISNPGIRWTTFDSGGSVTFRADSQGQPGLSNTFSHFNAALGAWRGDPNTPIQYLYGGTTGATGGLEDFDGVNAILFDDRGPESEFDDEPFTCFSGGVIAVGGPWFSGTHVHNGDTFRTAAGGDVVTNKGLGCITSNGQSWISQQKRAPEVFAHELGHTLGLGHSCGDSDAPNCGSSSLLNDALMRATIHSDNRGASLKTDDRNAIRFLYGEPLTPPAAPSNLAASAVSDTRIDLTWSDNATDETSFDVERQKAGGSFQLIASKGANSKSHQDTTALSGTTYNYRVRARNSAGVSGYSNTAGATTPGEAAPTDLAAAGLSSSAIRLTWTDNSTGEGGFEIEGKTEGGDFSLFDTVAADVATKTVSGLMEATSYTFRVRAVGGLGSSSYSNQSTATTFFADVEPCEPGATTLCLNDGRFKVEVGWRDFLDQEGLATDLGLPSNDSGLFWFFSANNWEMLIKVIDGCDFNDHFWVFAAATTDVEYELVVTDTVTGFSATYNNELGVSAPAITDTGAFATCSAILPESSSSSRASASAPLAAPPMVSSSVGEKQGTCVENENRLCLSGNRFAVEIAWRDYQDQTGLGIVDDFKSADSGLQYFFDPQILEVLVKVIDGCDFNDHFWVFAAATTDVEYTLRVTDTVTDKMVEYFNELGNAAAAITDTVAFEACDP